ncbi:zinc finger RNA-binding protein [Ricinus communis]|nr:zinc finger RNA-binding protein [Ricinus communis]
MNSIPNSNPPPATTTTTTADPYYSFYLQNPNPLFSLQLQHVYTDPSSTELRPPGVDSYPSVTSLPQQGHALSYTQVDASASGYCLDPNLQNWAAKEAVRQYGSDPAGYGAAVSVTIPQDGTEQMALAQSGTSAWTNFTFQIQGNGILNKRQKKIKVVQSAYCEVCKVDCNSKEVLDQHKLGKKHKKNVERLQQALVGPSASYGTHNPVIGPQQNPEKHNTGSVQRSKKKVAVPLEDLETKRRKIVEGGAAQEAVRVCAICNVVCNSDNVYNYHLAGRKHAAMLKKHGVKMVAAT